MPGAEKGQYSGGSFFIPAYCFAYCRSLSEISLGENILSIGESAFNGAALTAVRIPDSVKFIGENAFTTASELTEVVIGKGVVSIGKTAFYDLPKLQKVTFAEGSAPETLETPALRQSAPAGNHPSRNGNRHRCPLLLSL
ncbi:MAG: leucine-rich repeat domain-containing protein [Oscillospiraceae bacterium]|nr:MAG: leucine-rich repeat domain-containing protein [Oscillospiraceae bacterium]